MGHGWTPGTRLRKKEDKLRKEVKTYIKRKNEGDITKFLKKSDEHGKILR